MFRLKLVPSTPSIYFLKFIPAAALASITAVVASIVLFFVVVVVVVVAVVVALAKVARQTGRPGKTERNPCAFIKVHLSLLNRASFSQFCY
ncbi:MAG: hypothetical protein ACPG7D_02700 [Candidatus Puniceispirillaceae bacterium]